MTWLYAAALIVSIGGLALLDRRFSLAYWFDRRHTLYTLAAAVGIFIIWDILGIALGIFRHGGSTFTLPVQIGPEFPVEELFFLTLLCYVTLLIYRAWSRLC